MRFVFFGIIIALFSIAICLIYFLSSPKAAAATQGNISLSSKNFETKIKGYLFNNKAVNLDNIARELVTEQMVLNLIKGTDQDLSVEERDGILQHLEKIYYNDEEESVWFLKSRNLSKEDWFEIMSATSIAAEAKIKYMQLVMDELLSECAQKYGDESPADPTKILELFDQRIEQMVSTLPPISYNRQEIDKMVSSLEKWKQGVDNNVELPDVDLSL